jgi:hypothetical protein
LKRSRCEGTGNSRAPCNQRHFECPCHA